MFVYPWARREPTVCSLTGCHLRDCAIWPAHCRWGLEKMVMKVMVIARCKGKVQMRGSYRRHPTNRHAYALCLLVRLACTLSRRDRKTPLSKWGGLSLPGENVLEDTTRGEVHQYSNSAQDWDPYQQDFCTSSDDWGTVLPCGVVVSLIKELVTRRGLPTAEVKYPRFGSSPSSKEKEKWPSFPSAFLPLPIWALSSLVREPYKTRKQSWAWHWHMVLFKRKIHFYFWLYVYKDRCHVCWCLWSQKRHRTPWSWDYRWLWVTWCGSWNPLGPLKG